MKKVIAIVFCLQILSGNAFALELTKLPSLVQHYFEHEREEHPDLTFADFLVEHYMHDHSDELEGHCDEKLPFKHCHDCCTHSSSVSAFVMSDYQLTVKSEISEFEYHNLYYTNIPAGYLNCIWQPPRVG